jgi:hypothetical protein
MCSRHTYAELTVLSLQLKFVLGAFDLLGAACLWRKETRKLGLKIAIFGFSGGLYGQMYNNGDLVQVAAFLGLACIGHMLLSISTTSDAKTNER